MTALINAAGLPETLYAADPGVHMSDVSIFQGPSIAQGLAYLVAVRRCTAWIGAAPPGRIVLETPVVDRKKPRNSQDLVDLNGAGHWLACSIQAAAGYRCEFVKRPARSVKGTAGWKGSIQKPQHHRQGLKALGSAEIAILDSIKPGIWDYVDQACHRLAMSAAVTGYDHWIHNTLDSVCLGLTELGRMR